MLPPHPYLNKGGKKLLLTPFGIWSARDEKNVLEAAKARFEDLVPVIG